MTMRSSMADEQVLSAYLAQMLLGKTENIQASELIEQIHQLPAQVMVLENIENVMLRKVGGFETLGFLIDIVLHTSDKHFWLVTCNSYSWTIAKQAVRGVDCFTEHLVLRGLEEEQIAELIQRRHKLASHVALDFSALQLTSKSLNRLSSEERNQKAAQLYFRILWNYTRGNPRHAIYNWKASLNWGEQQLCVNLFDIPDQKILGQLHDGSLMLLAALIEHNGLDVKGLSQVMNTTNTIALRRIEEIAPYGMVFSVMQNNESSWHLESFWFKTIETYLVKRQFLFHGDQL
jgi:hypothetical protein